MLGLPRVSVVPLAVRELGRSVCSLSFVRHTLGTLPEQALAESASWRSEPKRLLYFADKLQSKTPGLGGRREEHENLARTLT